MYKLKAADWHPEHFKLEVADRVATITLNRPDRKNPLTFESYAELRDTFHKFQYVDDVWNPDAPISRTDTFVVRDGEHVAEAV